MAGKLLETGRILCSPKANENMATNIYTHSTILNLSFKVENRSRKVAGKKLWRAMQWSWVPTNAKQKVTMQISKDQKDHRPNNIHYSQHQKCLASCGFSKIKSAGWQMVDLVFTNLSHGEQIHGGSSYAFNEMGVLMAVFQI